MTQPDYGRLRASQADRERAIDVLKAAFAEGRLDQEEYTDRVGLAHAARTYADLGELIYDLPVGPFGTLPPAPAPAATPLPVPAPLALPEPEPEVPEPGPAALAPASAAPAARPRKPMSTIEIAGLAIMAILLPGITVPVALVALCVGLARSGTDSQPRARLTATTVLIILIGVVVMFRLA